MTPTFKNRTEAGVRLAAALEGAVGPDALVLAIPRGGVVVAAEVARVRGLELDLAVVRKLGAPGNPEFAIGAVDEDGNVIGGAGPYADASYVRTAAEAGRREIARRLVAYRGDRAKPRLSGREVVVVDDGIATGMTILAAVESLRRREAGRIVVAVPVASTSAARQVSERADRFIALETPQSFYAVGQFYSEFDQTSDGEVTALLHEAWTRDRPD